MRRSLAGLVVYCDSVMQSASFHRTNRKYDGLKQSHNAESPQYDEVSGAGVRLGTCPSALTTAKKSIYERFVALYAAAETGCSHFAR